MASLKIFLLGPARLERNGKLLELDTRKAIALLAYITLTGEIEPRDRLAALLWPELDDRRAKAALRRTLSTLKAAVGEEALYITREAIGVEQAAVWCDAQTFMQQIALDPAHEHPPDQLCPDCLKQLETAVTLYRDDFLAGFSLRDSLEFDDWQLQQAEYLRRELDGALEKLVLSYGRRGEFELALEHALRWLHLDPLREEAHRQLMCLYAWLGQRSAALLQYRDCVRVLEEELGVAPLAETAELYEAIQEDRLAKPAVVAPAAAPLPAAAAVVEPQEDRIPLVGREPELQQMHTLYQQIGADGRVLVVTGEAGIGKTMLAEHFVAQLPHALCLTARCYQGENRLAYAPFVQILREVLRLSDGADRLQNIDPLWLVEGGRLLPEFAARFTTEPIAPPPDWPGAASRFFEGLSQILDALLVGDQPGILWIDDVQWADTASLELLTFLTHRWRGRPYLLFLCWREGEYATDERLHQLLAAVRREQIGLSLTLNRLPREAVSQLVQATGSQWSDELANRFFQETEGLPLLIAAYLQAKPPAAVEQDWALPHTVRDLFQSRLLQASETGRQLLQTGAVIGRAFVFDTLQAVSGRSEDETLNGLEELLAHGLLTEQLPEAAYDFSHHKMREFVYEQMSLVRRRLLHRRVAQQLNGQAAARLDALASQIATHYQLAGLDSEAAGFYQRAGDYARALFAHDDALAHYQSALALGHSEAAQLHEAAADVQIRLGKYNAALTSYERAAASGDESTISRLEHKIGQVYYRLGEWNLAERYFERAKQLMKGDHSAQLAKLYIDWSTTAYRAGDIAHAAQLAEMAQQTAVEPRAQAQTYNMLGILARHQDELEKAQLYFEQSLALARRHTFLAAQISALNNLALVETGRSHFEEAQQLLQTALEQCLTYGDQHWEAALRNNLADLLHKMEQEELAMAQLKQAVVIYAKIGQESGGWQPEIWKLTEW
ncbi:MAG: AAA family ATPase, partial [Anaerolineales bacterium]|nr:AAA family ATPase [Anaerolineales bacterium]